VCARIACEIINIGTVFSLADFIKASTIPFMFHHYRHREQASQPVKPKATSNLLSFDTAGQAASNNSIDCFAFQQTSKK